MHRYALLAQGQTQGSTLTVHQQDLTTGPFGNTCKEDAVSPKVVIGGCRTHVSTTRGNTRWIQYKNNTTSRYHLPSWTYFAKLYVISNILMHHQSNRSKEHNINHTQHKIYVVHPLPRATST